MKERNFRVVAGQLNERGYVTAESFEEIEINNKKTPTVIYILGMLPGEKGVVKTFKTKRDVFYAHLIELSEPSTFRVNPIDTESYLASSPLQILSFESEQEYKQSFLKNLYVNETPLISTDEKIYGYRNKVEFGFYEDFEDYNLFLSFFKREGNSGKYILENGTAIADKKINKLGLEVVDILKKNQVSAKDLKSLLIRSTKKDAIANLYVTNQDFFDKYPDLKKELNNLPISVLFSDKKSPASINNGYLLQKDQYLTEEICGFSFKFALDGFFQVNIPLFEIMIEDVKKYISQNNINGKLLDLYSGVGVIGILLARYFESVEGVDSSEESKEYSIQNSIHNNLSNYNFVQSVAEKITDSISNEKILFLDPPRIGCHQKVIDQINKVQPEYIFYLSCNPITQARDFNLLKENYKIDFINGYNFYPRTPHLESLIILKKIQYTQT
ncbi:MAG: class I SAM-dependent RNA methyltransferase [Patescibacteria group bacterium]